MATYGGPKKYTQGLVLYLDAGNPKSHAGLGPELVTDANVAEIGDGNYVTISNGGTAIFSTGATVVANKTYQVSWRTLARRGTTSASMRVNLSGWSGAPNINAAPGTTYTVATTPNNSGPLNVITDNTGVDFDLDYLSVKELPTTWFDLSGNGNHGTNTGMTYSTANRGSFYFNDATSNNVSLISNSPSLNPTTGLTIEAWVNFNANTNDFIFEKGNVNTQYSLFSHSTDIMFRTVHTSVGMVNTSGLKANMGVVNGQWHHIVGSWDGAVKRIYVDGVLHVSANQTNPLVTTTPGAAVGRFGGITTGYYFGGFISSVAVYNRGLTAAEVLRHYINRRRRYTN